MYGITEVDREAAGRGDRRAWLLVRAERLSNEVLAGSRNGTLSLPPSLVIEWHDTAQTLRDEFGIIIYEG